MEVGYRYGYRYGDFQPVCHTGILDPAGMTAFGMNTTAMTATPAPDNSHDVHPLDCTKWNAENVDIFNVPCTNLLGQIRNQ